MSRPPFSNLTAFATRLTELVKDTKPGYTDADFVDDALKRYAEDYPCEVTADVGDGTTFEWDLSAAPFARFDRGLSDVWPMEVEDLDEDSAPYRPPARRRREADWWITPREEAATPPTAPTVALAGAGVGLCENGVHRVKVSFVLPQGETPAGTASDPVTVVDKATDGKIAVSAIPLGPVSCTARKVYMTTAGGSVYYLAATISDNTTTTATLNVSDASLTVAALSDDLLVPRLYLVFDSPPPDQQVRVHWRRRWRVADAVAGVSAAVNEVPLHHQDAVVYLAAWMKCDALASFYAGTEDHAGGSDIFEGKRSSEVWADRAKDWRKRYESVLGLGGRGGGLTTGRAETAHESAWNPWG